MGIWPWCKVSCWLSRLLVSLSWSAKNCKLVIKLSRGRTVLESSLLKQQCELIHSYLHKITGTHKHLEMQDQKNPNLLPAAQNKYWVLADLFTLLVIKKRKTFFGTKVHLLIPGAISATWNQDLLSCWTGFLSFSVVPLFLFETAAENSPILSFIYRKYVKLPPGLKVVCITHWSCLREIEMAGVDNS